MIHTHSISHKLHGALIVIIFLLASCVTKKEVLYLQNKAKADSSAEHINKRDVMYKIQAKDNLYIKINGLDDKTYQFFNKQGGSTGYVNDYNTDAAIYLSSYGVDDQGNITLAILGNIHVQGLTVPEAKEAIQKLVNEYLKETTVTVKLVNFNITVIGEVLRPGEYKIYQDQINMFQALSIAGDMTDYANRSQVQLVRQTKSGSQIHYLDLTSNKFLSSEYYYLLPNDIVYVSPLNKKRYGFTQFPYNTVFIAITALTSLILVIYTVKLY